MHTGTFKRTTNTIKPTKKEKNTTKIHTNNYMLNEILKETDYTMTAVSSPHGDFIRWEYQNM